MELGVRGKVALVAGSSQGLGRAVADCLAREGANLVLCARNADRLESAAREIQESSEVEVLAKPADVGREVEVQALFESALARFGRIDILVANAGGPPATNFLETKLSDWQEGLDLNLMSTIYLCRGVIPSMREHKWGRIVAITSVTVKQPIDGLILSNVSRLGVLGLTKTLAAELAADGITVNAVAPGFTRTERLVELASQMAEKEGQPQDAIYSRWTEDIPMGRLGEPREFAALVGFLASEQASYITGTCIQVDGGFVRGIL